jgi:transposase
MDPQKLAQALAQWSSTPAVTTTVTRSRTRAPNWGPVTVVVDGVQYPSVTAAAQALGVSRPTVDLWCQHHPARAWRVPTPPHPGPGMPVVVDGVQYPSRAAAARALGVHATTIREWIRTRPDRVSVVQPS